MQRYNVYRQWPCLPAGKDANGNPVCRPILRLQGELVIHPNCNATPVQMAGKMFDLTNPVLHLLDYAGREVQYDEDTGNVKRRS